MPVDEPPQLEDQPAYDFLRGGGEMGKVIAAKDWSRTPLGPIESWPQSLRTAVSLCRASNSFADSTETVGTADLNAALGKALLVLDGSIRDSGGTITAEPLPTVRGDEEQLVQVFQNLLSNSLKYRSSGEPARISISVRRDAREWVIAVKDNGIGFRPEYAERIFGIFKRLHKDEYPGTGLGLSICQRAVERCGGRIWAEGQSGQGATFYFALPILE